MNEIKILWIVYIICLLILLVVNKYVFIVITPIILAYTYKELKKIDKKGGNYDE